MANVSRKQTVIAPENVAKVSGIVKRNQRKSIRRTAAESGLKRSITQKITRSSLPTFPYKIQ